MSKRKMKLGIKQLGLKIPAAAYAALEGKAALHKVAPTTYARLLVLRHLGFESDGIAAQQPRKSVPGKLSGELKTGISFLTELHRLRVRLDQLAFAGVIGQGAGKPGSDLRAVQAALGETRNLLSKILETLAGVSR